MQSHGSRHVSTAANKLFRFQRDCKYSSRVHIRRRSFPVQVNDGGHYWKSRGWYFTVTGDALCRKRPSAEWKKSEFPAFDKLDSIHWIRTGIHHIPGSALSANEMPLRKNNFFSLGQVMNTPVLLLLNAFFLIAILFSTYILFQIGFFNSFFIIVIGS